MIDGIEEKLMKYRRMNLLAAGPCRRSIELAVHHLVYCTMYHSASSGAIERKYVDSLPISPFLETTPDVWRLLRSFENSVACVAITY